MDLDSRCGADLESLQAAGNLERAELQWRKDLVWHLPARHEIAARDFWRVVCGGDGGFDKLLTGCDFDLSSRLLGGVERGDFIRSGLRHFQIPCDGGSGCGKDGPVVVPTLPEELRSASDCGKRGEQLGSFAEGDGKALHFALR